MIIPKFTSLAKKLDFESMEKLVSLFGASLQTWLEWCGDLAILKTGDCHHGLLLYKQAKVSLLKRVLRVAMSGDSKALLKFIQLCMSSSRVEMSTPTKYHMGNFAIMVYAELVLRSVRNLRQSMQKEFTYVIRSFSVRG